MYTLDDSKLIRIFNGSMTVEKYGERVNIVEGRYKEGVFTFKDGSKKFLYQTWNENREKSELGERKRIVLMAARIIREHIQTHVFGNKSYPQPETLSKDLCPPIPETLKFSIGEVTKSETMKHKVTPRCAIQLFQ
ncbi:hypothetical protein AVEN_234258-1 [Araneus ventricosus]|uniref:Uncharacterized protein n=1 Tax=Araneus ventricosus TaxID=182803 RepID=A0A4Y2A995_ARAVE|nr:hypothetical protein AVEN_234258-1 [Araneus ventricosus]